MTVPQQHGSGTPALALDSSLSVFDIIGVWTQHGVMEITVAFRVKPEFDTPVLPHFYI